MDLSLTIQALQFVTYFTLVILLALFLGALVASFIRVVVQIDDQLINFTCKFFSLVATLYIGADYFSRELISFTQAIWQQGGYYF